VGFSWNVCSASVRSLMLYSLKRLSDVSTAKWLGLCWCQETCGAARGAARGPAGQRPAGGRGGARPGLAAAPSGAAAPPAAPSGPAGC
jgi:hypothetical protein